MSNFWPWFFGFLIALIVLAAMANPGSMEGALAFVGLWLTIIAWLLVAVAVAGSGIFVWLLHRRARQQETRQQDGAFPLQRFKMRDGSTLIYDPNLSAGPATLIDPGAGVIELEPAIGWQGQTIVRMSVERTRQLQAIFKGDSAHKDRDGSMSRGPNLTAAAARFAAGAYDKNPHELAETPARPALASSDATLAGMIDRSKPGAICFGQSVNDGELATWHVDVQPHLRLHGGTQKGKTSAAQTIAAGLLATGWQLVILDPRRFKDWSIAKGHAELVDVSRADAFADALGDVMAEYTRREALLGEHGASNIDELPASKRPGRLAVVIEEYGAQRNRAKGAGTVAEIDQSLGILTAEAAADGIHVIAIDQRPTDYDPVVKANLDAVVVFGLPEHVGAAAGYYHAHKLERYEFYFDGQIYRSIHAAPTFKAVVSGRSPVRRQDIVKTVHGPRSQAVHPEATPRAETFTNGDASQWWPLVAAYCQTHPDVLIGPPSGISDIARQMSVSATGSADDYERYKGIAHKVYHEYRRQHHAQ